MKTKINSKDFSVPAGKKVSLEKWPTLVKPVYTSKKEYTKLLQAQVEELSSMQRLHYSVVPDAITVARGDTVVWINELLREISRSLEMTIYVGAINRDHVHMLLGIRSL